MSVSSHISHKPHPKLHKIFCICYLGPHLTKTPDLCTVLPVLWVTSCFHVMRNVHTTIVIIVTEFATAVEANCALILIIYVTLP